MLADAEMRLRDAASKKILVEVALLKAIEARNAVPLDAVLKQLNQLRGGRAARRRSLPATASAAAAATRPAGTADKAHAAHQEAAAAPAALARDARRRPRDLAGALGEAR